MATALSEIDQFQHKPVYKPMDPLQDLVSEALVKLQTWIFIATDLAV